MIKDADLKVSFGTNAEVYEAARPRYPEALFDALIRSTHLKGGAQLLEIGPGTGQATKPLAKRGYRIIAVELSAELTRLAQKLLKEYDNVQVLSKNFESIEFPPKTFDLIYAATAFHWIQPEIKFTNSHILLKPGGHLAIIGTNHISDEAGDEFFFASQPIYKQYEPGGAHDQNFRLQRANQLKPDEVDEELFRPVFFDVFRLTIRYSAKEYAQLLSTYSPILTMEANKRTAFLQDIETLIEDKFDGSILKHFAMSLTIARKKDESR